MEPPTTPELADQLRRSFLSRKTLDTPSKMPYWSLEQQAGRAEPGRPNSSYPAKEQNKLVTA